MNALNEVQKQLLFDYSLGLTTEAQSIKALKLLSSSEEAAKIYARLKNTLSPLDAIEPEACPEDLAESTVLQLKTAFEATQLNLNGLLADELAKTEEPKIRSPWTFGRRLANAAVFMIAGGIFLFTWNSVTAYARQKIQCQGQMAQIFRGMNGYKADNNDTMPAVAAAAGTPWWKVGYQGKENYSNTRPIWLLVKNGYVNSSDFICPGSIRGPVQQWTPSKVKQYNDFRSRRHITYSVRVMCDKPHDNTNLSARALMADINPLFENLPDHSKPMRLKLNRKLSSRNSGNHLGRGQNVLFCDGSVKFVKSRRVGIENDDIFTIRDVTVYTGVEVPATESDAFLAP